MLRSDLRQPFAWAAAAGLMLAVALWRQDLVAEAARVTWLQLQAGGPRRSKLLVEIVLFTGILLYTLRVIPEGAEPRRDALRVVLALAAGWAAEAWGTRLGLWRYYTGEKPPLWIVPAWALGAVVVERTAVRWSTPFVGMAARPRRALYGAAASAMLAVVAGFAWPTASQPATWAVFTAVAAALFWRADPGRDLPILAAGLMCVLFADTWGTTNGCWRYWLQRPYGSWGLAAGVSFGACFDTAVVLGCLKAAKGLDGLGQRS